MLDDNIFADRKSRYAKQAQEIYEELINSIGGPHYVSEMQRQCAQRAAFMTLELRKMEATQAEDGTIDLDLYSKCVSTYRRLVAALNNRNLQPVRVEDPATSFLANLQRSQTGILATQSTSHAAKSTR